MKNPDNSQKKEFVYDNIKKLADVWEHIDKQSKNRILKTIISKIIIVNGNIEIQLKNFSTNYMPSESHYVSANNECAVHIM